MKLGNNLKNIREEKQIRIEDVSNSLKISVEDIESWESNKRVPNMDQLVLLSEYYEIDLDSLLFNDIKLNKIPPTEKVENYNINEERQIDVFRRQKKLVKISSIILFIDFMILFVLSMIFLGFFIASIINLNFDSGASFLIFGIGIILTYYTFKLSIKLRLISNYSDLEFVQATDLLLKYGIILTLITVVIPGVFLIAIYFTTDSEKYYVLQEIYKKNEKLRKLIVFSAEDLIKMYELNNKGLITDYELEKYKNEFFRN